MEYDEILSYALVRYDGQLYGVWDDEWEDRSARLLPLAEVERYEGDEAAGDALAIAVPYRQICRIEPAEADPETVRRLFRLDALPWTLARQGMYPFSSATHRCLLTEEDLLCLIDRLTMFRNDFLLYAWRETFQYHGMRDHLELPPLTEEGLMGCLLADRFFAMMDWFTPEEEDWHFIFPLRDAFLRSRGKPVWEADIPEDFLGDVLTMIERLAEHSQISRPLRAYYERTLEQLFRAGDFRDIQRYAYAYYGGNGLVPCDWKKSEQALLCLFDPDADPPQGNHYAANSLGYIYYSNRLGKPDCEKAFRCFSFAAQRGSTEAAYKLSDLYRKGDGTPQNKEKAFALLSDLWHRADKRKISRGKYADIALRMGYCYRDGIGVAPDPETALDFFLKARRGLQARMKRHPGFGDETVMANIERAIASVQGGERERE